MSEERTSNDIVECVMVQQMYSTWYERATHKKSHEPKTWVVYTLLHGNLKKLCPLINFKIKMKCKMFRFHWHLISILWSKRMISEVWCLNVGQSFMMINGRNNKNLMGRLPWKFAAAHEDFSFYWSNLLTRQLARW